MSNFELKQAINNIHKIWYDGKFLGNNLEANLELLKFHQNLETLFNYAEITETVAKEGDLTASTLLEYLDNGDSDV